MKTTFIKGLMLLSIIVCQISHAQDNVFAFAYDETGSSEGTASSKHAYKEQVISEIFNDLIEAKGVFNMPKPSFELKSSTKIPAYINLKEAKVVIEEKAYDICSSMGADSLSALAALLAHELTHYYEKHDWKANFLHFYQSKDAIANAKMGRTYEVQADQLGGFLANMAGYNTSGVLELLLTKVYTEYNLNAAANSHYPSLQDRIDLARKSEEILAKMSYAFDMSSLLTVIGSYNHAYHYLDYIIQKGGFQSREIYNNQAVLLMLSALPLYSNLEMPLALPIEYDFDSRLGRRSNENQRNQILDRAEELLNKAIALDEAYLPAATNLVTLYILKGDYFEAEYHAKKLLLFQSGQDDKFHQSQARINMGVIAFMREDKEEALNQFNEAEKLYPREIITYNKNIVKGLDQNHKSSRKNDKAYSSADSGLNKMFSKLMQDELSPANEIEIDKKNLFFTVNDQGFDVLVNMNDYGEGGCHFFQQRNHFVLNEIELNTKTLQSDIESLIGVAQKTFATGAKSISLYPDQSLIVTYGPDQRPISFVHYHEER